MTKRSDIRQCYCHRQDGPERLGKWIGGRAIPQAFRVPSYAELAAYCDDAGVSPEDLAKDCKWQDMGGQEAAGTCRGIWKRAKDKTFARDLVPWRPVIEWYVARQAIPQDSAFPSCARCGRPCIERPRYCSNRCQKADNWARYQARRKQAV